MKSLIITSELSYGPDLVELLEQKLEAKFENNPDVMEFNKEGESVKIKLIREINSQLHFRPFVAGGKRTLVIYGFEQATIPAQNAFLKSLEEPPEFVQLVLVAKNLTNILGTIQSRCTKINLTKNKLKGDAKNDSTSISQIYDQITNSSYGQLVDLATDYKNREDALKLLQDLTQYLHQQQQKSPSPSTQKHLDSLAHHHQLLEQNTNVLLTLEECFFIIKN